MKPVLKTVLATLIATTGLGVAAVLTLPYSGVLDVSADSPPSATARWFLGTTRQHSVSSRAARMAVPDLNAPARLAEGAEHYRSMCVGCHGAPGVERDEVGRGLEPQPPKLSGGSFDDERARATFWVVKHGIRMTGMPAFGRTHDDEKIWDIVAFVRRLQGMTAEEYKQTAAPAGEHDDEGHER